MGRMQCVPIEVFALDFDIGHAIADLPLPHLARCLFLAGAHDGSRSSLDDEGGAATVLWLSGAWWLRKKVSRNFGAQLSAKRLIVQISLVAHGRLNSSPPLRSKLASHMRRSRASRRLPKNH